MKEKRDEKLMHVEGYMEYKVDMIWTSQILPSLTIYIYIYIFCSIC